MLDVTLGGKHDGAELCNYMKDILQWRFEIDS